jgi:hypothetical protein
MDCEFPERAESAQDNVECNPGERKPPCPVVTSQQKCSRDNCYELREFDPYAVVRMRKRFAKVVSKADCAHAYIHAPENLYREGAFMPLYDGTGSRFARFHSHSIPWQLQPRLL